MKAFIPQHNGAWLRCVGGNVQDVERFKADVARQFRINVAEITVEERDVADDIDAIQALNIELGTGTFEGKAVTAPAPKPPAALTPRQLAINEIRNAVESPSIESLTAALDKVKDAL